VINPTPTTEDKEELAKMVLGCFFHLIDGRAKAEEVRKASFHAVDLVCRCLAKME
jgi:hypothetical protein